MLPLLPQASGRLRRAEPALARAKWHQQCRKSRDPIMSETVATRLGVEGVVVISNRGLETVLAIAVLRER